MDNARKYIEEARQKNIPDEDIIADLMTAGWSMQQVHQLLYNDHSAASSNPAWMTENRAQPQPVVQPQVINTTTPHVQQVQQIQPPAVLPSVPPEIEPSAKPAHRPRKIILTILLFGFVFALGVGTGVGGGYLYIKSQVKKYAGTESNTPTENNTVPISVSTVDSAPNQSTASSASKTSSAPSNNSSPSNSGQSKCQPNTKNVPDAVCAAIDSITKDASKSNPYFSKYKGEIPSGVKIVSVDLNSWSPQSASKGTINVVASFPVSGKTSLTALFENISGEWKVIEIY